MTMTDVRKETRNGRTWLVDDANNNRTSIERWGDEGKALAALNSCSGCSLRLLRLLPLLRLLRLLPLLRLLRLLPLLRLLRLLRQAISITARSRDP